MATKNSRKSTLRIGTRGSPLALAQAYETRDRLMQAHGWQADQFEIVVISTTGDQIQNRPLADIGGKGLFTQEIEQALFNGSIDIAVHSMKDMPAVLPDGLSFAGILPREDAHDAFVSLSATSLRDLPAGALLGSSSVRRTAQALRIRPDLQPVQFRGNVNTRLAKLQSGVAAGTFLAVAGLNRLGMSQHITAIMDMDDMLPAVAQGAIAIEIKSGNAEVQALIDPIHDKDTGFAIACERAFLAQLEGSCRTPIAGHATVTSGVIMFRGQVLSVDGKTAVSCMRRGPNEDATRLGVDAARELQSKLP